MNWVFGIEFVEVDPVSVGTEQFEEITDRQERQRLIDNVAVDRERLRALHGTAILSRYPIRRAELHPFRTQGYDWFQEETQRISRLEEEKRGVTGHVFLEKVSREIRRGGRSFLVAILDVPELPGGSLMIAAPHLENRGKPRFRRAQMREVLNLLRDVSMPVVVAGDLNTTFTDTRGCPSFR